MKPDNLFMSLLGGIIISIAIGIKTGNATNCFIGIGITLIAISIFNETIKKV